MKRLTLSIDLLEDLHIGTGTSLGDIDALQVRDRRGWPVLPASHIKGLLREAANEWRRFEPSAISKDDVEYLFGRSGDGQGQLQLTSAYLRADATTSLLVWGSTQIDDTGTAAEQSLRFVEYIPAGSCFDMQVTLPACDENSEELLKAIIARCGRLGGGRNRGYGLVQWHLKPATASNLIPLQEIHAYPCRLRLLLRNLDPICLARTGHPGNLIASESFIRGRSLRGAFVAACLSLGQTQVAQSLLADTLSWGDALPLPDADLAGAKLTSFEVVPIQLSVGTPKATAPSVGIPWWADQHEGVFFGSHREIDQVMLNPGTRPAEKLKRPASGEFLFRHKPQESWQRYRPQILERLHTRVSSDENNREQALFSTEEIAENTLFLSDLIVSTPDQFTTIKDVLHSLTGRWLRIGRGGRPLVIEAAAWLPLAEHGTSTEQSFTLLLESDLIVRNTIGNFRERLDANTIVELACLPANSISIEANLSFMSFSESCDIFGFNASTGLPRLAQRAIKAGSVIRVSGPDVTLLREALAKQITLGECPEEGFGRFRLDRLPIPQPNQGPQILFAEKHVSSTEDMCYKAQRWVKKFDRSLFAPSKSQWSDFRSRNQSARSHKELEDVFCLIERAKDKHGGKSWQVFVEHKHYGEFRKDLAEMPLIDAQAFLEYFFRWQRALSNKPEAC